MHALDPKTLRRLAEIVVDVDGPYERTGRVLETLLCDSGWDRPPVYDGSARVAWLIEELERRRPEEVAALIRRVCSTVETGDRATADAMCAAVNAVLAFERLRVAEVRGRPVIIELRESGDGLVDTAPADLRTRLPRFVHDDRVVEHLVARAEEAAACERAGAYSMAVIGVGSFLEGLLYAALYEHDAEFRDRGLPKEHGRGRTPPERVALRDLIDVAHQRGWVHVDARVFAHHVREYRNFVHLRNQMDEGFPPDGDTVMLCWAPIQAVINDLDTALAD